MSSTHDMIILYTMLSTCDMIILFIVSSTCGTIILFMILPQINCCALGSNGSMSLAYPSNNKGRSGSGETQARPKVTGQMMANQALFPNLIEKSLIAN